jgi:addiction module RelE/StbE family toxin
MSDSYRIIYSPRVASDLHDIFDFINEQSPQNALTMLRKIVNAIDSLEQFPHRYPEKMGARNRRGPTRVMPVPPYLILYRILEQQNAVRLITVRHGARRRRLRDD